MKFHRNNLLFYIKNNKEQKNEKEGKHKKNRQAVKMQ